MAAQFYVEYMDTKRFSVDASLPILWNLYRMHYDRVPLDLIIVSDDNALNFILANRKKTYPNVPVVFCGINKRSPLAADTLQRMGYQDVYNYADGFFAWRDATGIRIIDGIGATESARHFGLKHVRARGERAWLEDRP